MRRATGHNEEEAPTVAHETTDEHSPRPFAERAAKLISDAQRLDMRDMAYPLVIAEAHACAVTALALAATQGNYGIAVDAGVT